MRLKYDPDVDALHVWLREVPYAYGYSLDLSRRIDYGLDRQPMGVEFLNASDGVNLRGIPEAGQIAALLRENKIPIAA